MGEVLFATYDPHGLKWDFELLHDVSVVNCCYPYQASLMRQFFHRI